MQILALISEDPAYTSTTIADKLSISRKTVSQRLKELKEKGIIERIGSDRKGYYKELSDTELAPHQRSFMLMRG